MCKRLVKQCPHYRLESEYLVVGLSSASMNVNRCLLMERLISLLKPSSEGGQFAQTLEINGANGNRMAFVGPDLDSATRTLCTPERCSGRCARGYAERLEQFGVCDPEAVHILCRDEDIERRE